jgi:hypothetical protein
LVVGEEVLILLEDLRLLLEMVDGGGGGGIRLAAAGHGGSGIVVVRYQIGQLTATAKATGGAISY